MPRIRKKTSKRISTQQRAKFKHKVAEGRKKKKKEAKKNPEWKSKKKKDPGIPNNFPYKDQILAEVAETRRQAEESKQRRKEEKRAAREGLLVEEVGNDVNADDSLSAKSSFLRAQMEDEAPLLLNPDLPDLKAVLEKADVILQVLDARDPTSCRLPHVEKLASVIEQTKLVFVLNKIDLVPREVLTTWLKYLRTQHPTFLFHSASSFLPKPPLNDPKAKGKAKEAADDATGAEILLEYFGQCASRIQSETLQVAVVGLTNSGKSSIVNSLARKAVVSIYSPTSSTDAWSTTTTRPFEVLVQVSGHKLNLVDTPGVSFQVEPDPDETLKTRDMLLRRRGRVDKVKDPVPAVEHIVSRADTRDLMVHYNLPAFAPGDCPAFLAGVARSTGLLKKRGEADLTQAARTVLRDWTTGKLPIYTDAPTDYAADMVNGQMDEVSLGELYARGDEVALVSVRTRREMRNLGGLVRIERGEVEERQAVLDAPFVVEEKGDRESGKVEEDEEDKDEENEESDEEDVASGDNDEDEKLRMPTLTGKRKRQEVAAASTAPPTKKVAFAAGTRDRKERQPARSASKSAIKPTPNPTSKPTSKPPQKNPPLKVTPAKAKTGTNATTGKDTDTYDFDQFFKS